LEALLELLAVEVGIAVPDLGLHLPNAALDRLEVTAAVDDRIASANAIPRLVEFAGASRRQRPWARVRGQ
jgi:hypothetical protein